jgi:hypothetical protein
LSKTNAGKRDWHWCGSRCPIESKAQNQSDPAKVSKQREIGVAPGELA